MDELARTKSLLEHLNVGVLKYLEKKTGVCKAELEPRRPADRSAVLSWEQRNTCFLPEDLKSSYLTTDGFQLTWSVKIESPVAEEQGDGKTKAPVVHDGPIAVGRMCINSISKLLRIGGVQNPSLVNPSLADLDCDSDLEDETSGFEKPTFDGRCKVFELDPCDSFGKVCLVYRESKTGGTDPKIEIWFLDRGLRWHYIADSFMAYYRLMIMHLGLPQWQYAFTDIGLSQQAKQWFNMYAPLRLELDTELGVISPSVESNSSTTQLDVGKVFKGKTDKNRTSFGLQTNRKPVPAQTQSQQSQSVRKKQALPSAKTQQQAGLKTSGSSSQLSKMSK